MLLPCLVGHSWAGEVQDNNKQLLPRSAWNHRNEFSELITLRHFRMTPRILVHVYFSFETKQGECLH